MGGDIVAEPDRQHGGGGEVERVDETGRLRPAPMLRHDMPKVGVRGYLLPIDDEAAEIETDNVIPLELPLPSRDRMAGLT